MKSIENPLDFELKRLFEKVSGEVEFPHKEDEMRDKIFWTENLIRKGIGKENRTRSDSSDKLFIDNELESFEKEDVSMDSESHSSYENNDDINFAKYDSDFEVVKVEDFIRKAIDKSELEGERENLIKTDPSTASEILSSNEHHSLTRDSGFKVGKVEEFIRKALNRSELQDTRENEAKTKNRIPTRYFKKISEDKYLQTIFRKDDKKSKMKNRLVELSPKRKIFHKNKNPERIIEKINNLNENEYNRDTESKKGFELTKPSKPKTLVKWKENVSEPAETTTRKMKLRRRKKKKIFKEESDPERINVVHESDFQEKVRKPLKKEWNSIFQTTTFPRVEYSVTTEATTSKRPNKFFKKSFKRKNPQNRDLSMLRGLVEKYCRFEDSIGIMKLCESQKLSNNRKHLKDDVSVENVPKDRVGFKKDKTSQKTEIKKEKSFMENVKSAFSSIFSYF